MFSLSFFTCLLSNNSSSRISITILVYSSCVPNSWTKVCKASTATLISFWVLDMIPLPEYAKIKDNFCIAYYGYNKEYLVQLRLLRSTIEEAFPGIKIYLCSRDELTYLFKQEPRTLSKSELWTNKNQFAYVREISYKNAGHPVENLLAESDVKVVPIFNENSTIGKPVLLTKSITPTRSLSHTQIQSATEHAKSKGFDVNINDSWENYDWIISVENEYLYEAAAAGKKVTLISTGIGENLFKSMFPKGEIISL